MSSATSVQVMPPMTNGHRHTPSASAASEMMVPDLHLGLFSHLGPGDFDTKDTRYPAGALASVSRRPLSMAIPAQASTGDADAPDLSEQPTRQSTTDSDVPLFDTPLQQLDQPLTSHGAEATFASSQPPVQAESVAIIGARAASPHDYSALPPGAARASTFASGSMTHALRQGSTASASGVAAAVAAATPSVNVPSSATTPNSQSMQPTSTIPTSPSAHISPPNSSQIGSAPMSVIPAPGGPRHPAIVSVRSSTGAKRVTPVPASAPPRGTFPASPTYPSIINAVTNSPVSLQDLIATEAKPSGSGNGNGAAPRKKPDEEVCIECMMRDRDMADVDVTSPGVWARDSDADYLDLIRREQEEETQSLGQGSSSSGHGSRRKVRSRGGKLTEENVKKWLLMNPKDHESRWRTITKYVKAQGVLLEAEFAARARAEAEARTANSRMRDAYTHLRRSTADTIPDEPAVRIRMPATRAASPGPTNGYFAPQYETDAESLPATPGRVLGLSDTERERDVVLLESGMMVERVDVRRTLERSQSRGRRNSQGIVADKQIRRSGDERASMYSAPSPLVLSPTPGGAPSTRASSLGIPHAPSQVSIDSSSPRRSRFFGGLRQSFAGSMVSLAASRASVVNMHAAAYDERLPTERSLAGISMPALNDFQQEWQAPSNSEREAAQAKPKKKGLSRLFKIFTGGKSGSKTPEPRAEQHQQAEDLSEPLAPPPPLTYLMNRTTNERQVNGHSRALSTPSSANQGTGTLRSPGHNSVIGSPVMSSVTRPSPPTAPSSILPSPTSIRYSWRGSNASLDQPAMPQPIVVKDRVDFPALSGVEDREIYEPAVFEAELKRRQQLSVPFFSTGPRSSAAGIIRNPSPRPYTMFLDKNLPPLPPGEAGSPGDAPGAETSRGVAMRRNSFAGVSDAHPPAHLRNATVGPSVSPGYADEFGNAPLPPAIPRARVESHAADGRRRSRFALSTLFGRGRDKEKDRSEHSSTRASNDTQRRLDYLVAQDDQLVAYRYPTGDEALDLLRR